MFKTDLFLDATSVLTFVKIRIYIKKSKFILMISKNVHTLS